MRRWGFSENRDIISDLPQSLIGDILTKLPIRDAVRTSILSSRWRYQWTNMTELVFNSKCVNRPYTLDKLVNCMMPCLLLHDGHIHKFKLCIPPMGNSPGIDQCLLFLSRRGIKELDLRVDIEVLGPPAPGERQLVHTAIFSCQQLTRLTLCGLVVQPPPNCRGFPCLKHLSLDLCTVTLEVIENLISGSPFLESFEIDYNDDQLALTVNAPNLKHLTMAGTFRDVYLEHTPLLVVVSVNFISQAWEGDVFMKLPTTYNDLKFIKAMGVNFQEMNEASLFHHLILHAPNLEKLQISAVPIGYPQGNAADLDVWDEEGLADFKFRNLKSVKMWDVSNEYDIEFIKFVLGRSPVLQMISISLEEDCIGKLGMVNQVLHFRRASPEVDIVFFD
ncbi:hypothetical protein DCAR_0209248 [Daucus carota subsp. sativus]|uniref:FBD domain-containing protein n=2 Tax=Daucus carota subsp. sativus TaxID=79200 RepID=A0AAF0WHH4_DAUCS|nr:hypothetical protein DCAR_0209248 [Daucus carota subsp. sativus]